MTKHEAEAVKRALEVTGAGDAVVMRIGPRAWLVHLMHGSGREDFTEMADAERYIVQWTDRVRGQG